MRWLSLVASALAVSASQSFLFRGTQSAVQSLTKSDVEVVVARYNEDVDWTGPYKHLVTIYNKSPVQVEGSVHLPNVGRESHTYLTHVVQNYDNLAQRTVFTQATAPSHGYRGHRAGGGHLTSGVVFEDYLLSKEPVQAFFTERMHIDTLKHQMRGGYRHELTLAAPAGSCPLGQPDTNGEDWDDWGYWTNLGWFDKFLQNKCAEQGGNLTLRQYWDKYLQRPVPPQEIIHFAQGSIFSVDKEEILSHPLSYYKQLLELVSNDADPWAGYYNEWLWYYIFRRPEFNGELCPVQEPGFSRRRVLAPLSLESDCYYGCPDWDDWDVCMFPPQGGQCQQSRDCLDPNCPRDTRLCEPNACLPDCDDVETCDEWTDWTLCDAVCGGGSRHRNCTSCNGLKQQTSDCNTDPCPSGAPTLAPTSAPTQVPSANPTDAPSLAPTTAPTSLPTLSPSTPVPSHAPTASPTPCTPCTNFTCTGECGARVKLFTCDGPNLCAFPVNESCPWSVDTDFDGVWAANDTECSVTCGDKGFMKPRSCVSKCGGVTPRAQAGAVGQSRCVVLDTNTSCSPAPPACRGAKVEVTIGFPTLDIHNLPDNFESSVVSAVAESLQVPEDNVEYKGAFEGSVNVLVDITTESPAAEAALRDQMATGGAQLFNSALQDRGLPEAVVQVKASDTQTKESSDDLSGGEIAGIVIGVVAGVALLIFAGWCVLRRRTSPTDPAETDGILATGDEEKHPGGPQETVTSA